MCGLEGRDITKQSGEVDTWFCAAGLPSSAGYFPANTGDLVHNDYSFVWHYWLFCYYARHTQSVQHPEMWVFTRKDGTWRNKTYIDGSSVLLSMPSGRRIFNLVQFCDILNLKYWRFILVMKLYIYIYTYTYIFKICPNTIFLDNKNRDTLKFPAWISKRIMSLSLKIEHRSVCTYLHKALHMFCICIFSHSFVV
jgi:hypothetical protein